MTAQSIPTPDPRELLPPLLACLPTAFVSPRPPPALFPLLTPILRQRVQLLSAGATSSGSWLALLCWDKDVSAKLTDVVERIQIEPHPVSGEIELQDVDTIEYRRLDAETLHCRMHVDEYNLLPIYLWCMGDNPGWRLAELRTYGDRNDGSHWQTSMEEANKANDVKATASRKDSLVAHANGSKGYGLDAAQDREDRGEEAEEEDDSAYWAAYDRTPGRTPAKRSPAPGRKASSSVQIPTASELEYFARYMAEVQPAMDPHDPTEETLQPGESTLNGNTFHTGVSEARDAQPNAAAATEPGPPQQPLTNGNLEFKDAQETEILQPRPSSSSSSSLSGSVARLERQAAEHNAAEIGIKQHIATDIKSLYRLARSAGIDRAEFERIVRTELDVLSLMDLDQ